MRKNTMILAVETSCDETAAAVIRNGDTIVSSIIASQMESHKRFGGVVPEIASRHHVEQITLIMEEAMTEADVTFADLDAIAVTEGPGLVGALLVGVNAAKAVAFAHDLPLIGVHHIAGHIYANHLVEPLTFPLMTLVVSGGHTELIYMKEHGSYELIGETRDDAVGEAYDKVARTIGLPYPGGPHIDKLAQTAEAEIDLPRAWLEEGSYDFSFSGLKSSVINTLHNARQKEKEIDPAVIAASFQEAVCDVLVTKTRRAAKEYGVKRLLVAGGVAANSGLRTALETAAEEDGLQLTIPPLPLCTDNAAMIGSAAHFLLEKEAFADDRLNGVPGLMLK
ncbi:tRNA (adenosine(37)-N6)-threonylcarbamoyltransferase complex transferase subunit TsaD [Alkalicoccus halolimnae]|uniref:tRNA N6-adenosine threonylcarbamoyltransferase n=1 Tax=Alkalicoccus halolimnae TaxID=1667239 RepID=A0A5C7F6E0_9BACI|nr:tRNA (adenosine(37)-N6)-threonylcarbamoyltransferase complex transferase subunit TsaD [Alkalicoccus halolimnae]TXF86252.1 tRNA (adenosine(37)-N6)-threonylcarbamoyltransferase complex transferase subunit TsaD [Alkalicoccus halolimnae]